MIRIDRRDMDEYFAAGPQDAMQFFCRKQRVADMFKNRVANDRIYRIVRKRDLVYVADHISTGRWIVIHAFIRDIFEQFLIRSKPLLKTFAAADIKDVFFFRYILYFFIHKTLVFSHNSLARAYNAWPSFASECS